MDNILLNKYAALTVRTGVNILKDDVLVINSSIETSDFARALAKEAYLAGAKDVIVHYSDGELNRIKLENSSIETLSSQPEWFGESYNYYARNGACFISISSADPDCLKGVPADKIGANQKSRSLALKEYYENSMSNKCRWCVVAYPSVNWAKKVFPDSTEAEAMDKLFNAIISASRVDKDDPTLEWEQHNKNLEAKRNFLNKNDFAKVVLKNSKGTELSIELPEKHVWLGGVENSQSGVPFNANIPTEEVFTLPKKNGVNGVVHSTKPLIYGGNLIENFSLTFKDGKVIDFTCEKGYDVLNALLDTDDGSRYLGEVALVPFNSPISNSNLIFFNTLFDENAACHLAFGRAYPCLEDAEDLSKDQLAVRGVNDSLVHVDFMIGSEDLEIIGIKKDNTETAIFTSGNWAF